MLQTFLATYSQFAQFNLCDSTGKVLVSSSQNGRLATGISVAHEDFFRRAMQGETYISSPKINESIGEKAVMISSPVKVPSGKIAGIFYCVLTCKEINHETVVGFKLGEGGYSFVADAKSGLVLANPDEGKIATYNLYNAQPWLKTAVPGRGEIKNDYITEEGIRHLVAYYVERSSGWIALSCVPYTELMSQVDLSRNITIGLMVGVGSYFLISLLTHSENYYYLKSIIIDKLKQGE